MAKVKSVTTTPSFYKAKKRGVKKEGDAKK